MHYSFKIFKSQEMNNLSVCTPSFLMFTAQARKQLSAMCHKIQFLHKGIKINPQLNISNIVVLLVKRPRRFGSVVAHRDLDREVFSSSHVWVTPKTSKMVLTGHQPVLVIMSLSKGNTLTIKRRSLNFIQWTSRQRWYDLKSWPVF